MPRPNMNEPWALIICTTTSLNSQIGPQADLERYVDTGHWRFYCSWPSYEDYSNLTEDVRETIIRLAREAEIRRRKGVTTPGY